MDDKFVDWQCPNCKYVNLDFNPEREHECEKCPHEYQCWECGDPKPRRGDMHCAKCEATFWERIEKRRKDSELKWEFPEDNTPLPWGEHSPKRTEAEKKGIFDLKTSVLHLHLQKTYDFTLSLEDLHAFVSKHFDDPFDFLSKPVIDVYENFGTHALPDED